MHIGLFFTLPLMIACGHLIDQPLGSVVVSALILISALLTPFSTFLVLSRKSATFMARSEASPATASKPSALPGSQRRPFQTSTSCAASALLFLLCMACGCHSACPSAKPALDHKRTAPSDYAARVYRGLDAFRTIGPSGAELVGDNSGRFGLQWTKCTNLGFVVMAELVAEASGLAATEQTRSRVDAVLTTLQSIRSYRGIFPEFIKLEGKPQAEIKEGAIAFSSLDSAWVTLALSLVVARYGADFPPLAARAAHLIERQDYTALVESDRLLGGVTVDASTGQVRELARFGYGDKNSEARPLILALTGLRLLPPSVWDNMTYSWTVHHGLPLADGFRRSAFVELSGQLFFDEVALAPHSLGLSHVNYARASRIVARERAHKVWGYAPSCTPKNGYGEYGLDNPDVVTPYASAALATTGEPSAIANLDRVLDSLDWTGGPAADGLDPLTLRPVCSDARLLDQALLFLALKTRVLRALARRTEWYASAEARLRSMDREQPPSAEAQ